MPLMYQYADWEASPFDEPPVTAELDLDRMMYDIKKGSPPLSQLSRTFVLPTSAKLISAMAAAALPTYCKGGTSDFDDNNGNNTNPEDDVVVGYDDGASRPEDESTNLHEHHYKIPVPVKISAAKRQSSFQKKSGKSSNRTTTKNKRISFSKQLVDVVPEQWMYRNECAAASSSFSIVSSRLEDDLEGLTAATGMEDDDNDDDDDDDDEDSFLSQEADLDYFWRGDWLDHDELLSPINCKGTSNRRRSSQGSTTSSIQHRAYNKKYYYTKYLCGLDEAALHFPMWNASHFSSKPFSVPFKWKEYTSLDLSESLCRSESCLNHRASRRSTTQFMYSNEDDDVSREKTKEEASASRHNASCSSSSNLRDMIPPIQESLQGIFGRFFEDHRPPHTTDKEENMRVAANKKRKVKGGSDSLSLSNTNISDSDESVLAGVDVRLIMKAASE